MRIDAAAPPPAATNKSDTLRVGQALRVSAGFALDLPGWGQAGVQVSGPAPADDAQFNDEHSVRHRVGPAESAKQALISVDEELGRWGRQLRLVLPELKRKDWDIGLDKEGRLRFVADLDKAELDRLSAQLQGNARLVGAVTRFVAASVAYLETSDSNPPSRGQNASTGAVQWYSFDKVGEQLQGLLRFKALFNETRELDLKVLNGADPPRELNPYFGHQALELLASKLKPTLPPGWPGA